MSHTAQSFHLWFHLHSGQFISLFWSRQNKKIKKKSQDSKRGRKNMRAKLKGTKKKKTLTLTQYDCVCHVDMFIGRPFRPVSESCSPSKQWGWGTSSSTYHNNLVTLKGGSNSPPTRHCILFAHSFFSLKVVRGCALSAFSRYEQFTLLLCCLKEDQTL